MVEIAIITNKKEYKTYKETTKLLISPKFYPPNYIIKRAV